MPYSLEVSINGKLISLDKDFSDPFLISELHISLWDILKSLFRMKMIVMWKIDADKETIFRVMNLYSLEVPKEWQDERDQSSQ